MNSLSKILSVGALITSIALACTPSKPKAFHDPATLDTFCSQSGLKFQVENIDSLRGASARRGAAYRRQGTVKDLIVVIDHFDARMDKMEKQLAASSADARFASIISDYAATHSDFAAYAKSRGWTPSASVEAEASQNVPAMP